MQRDTDFNTFDMWSSHVKNSLINKCLVLLDMSSAAFDLIRHDILEDTLQTHFGYNWQGIVTGNVIFGW